MSWYMEKFKLKTILKTFVGWGQMQLIISRRADLAKQNCGKEG